MNVLHQDRPARSKRVPETSGGLPSALAVADWISLTAVVFSGAIFGFFYAWVCSTMWGLDDIDPRIAIEAMRGMNASVRNAVFFPAFFFTPVMLGLAALLLRRTRRPESARWFAAAAVVYALGGLFLTMVVNVPMNETLAAVTTPLDRDAAAAVWHDYSTSWQIWNALRTIASGLALGLAANGLRRTRSEGRQLTGQQ